MKTLIKLLLLVLACLPIAGQAQTKVIVPFENPQEGDYTLPVYRVGEFQYPRDEVFFLLEYKGAKASCCLAAKVYYTSCDGEEKYAYAAPIDNTEAFVVGENQVAMRLHFSFNAMRGSDCIQKITGVYLLPLKYR